MGASPRPHPAAPASRAAASALARAIEAYDRERIMERLCSQHGYRLTVKAIGHSKEDTEDVER